METASELNRPFPLLPERVAAQRAIAELEGGRPSAALELLREALRRRRPPQSGTDTRPMPVVRLRAYIEQAICELEHGCPDFALRDLRSGIGNPRGA